MKILNIFILFIVVIVLPGKALGEERKADRGVYYPCYDLLSDYKMPVEDNREKTLVPESMSYKKAIGYGGDPGLYNGLSFKYWFKDDMAVSVCGKLLLKAGNDNFEHNLNIRPKILFNISKGNELLLNLFAGMDILFSGNTGNPAQDEWHLLYAIAGVSPELFVTDNFSIETSFGVYLELLGGGVDSGAGYNTISLGTMGSGLNLPTITFNIYF